MEGSNGECAGAPGQFNDTPAPLRRWGEAPMTAGQASREACGDACSASDDCSGFEWYPSGWNGYRCYRIPNGEAGNRANVSVKGLRVNNDAECWVPYKEDGPSEAGYW